jgi:hypothetical protein
LSEDISILYNELSKNEVNSLKKINDNNEKIKALKGTKSLLDNTYLKKEIDKEHYDSLTNEISILYQELFNKRIAEVYNTSIIEDKKVVNQIKNEIYEAYSNEKINVKHYNLLKEKILEVENNDNASNK